MKTKALLACSVTIFLMLGVVGIASAAPPAIGDKCNCDCVGTHDVNENTPPFCWGSHPQDFIPLGRWAGNCLAACLRDIPYECG